MTIILSQCTNIATGSYRTLRGLLSARGANASLVTVFIDGFFQEPKDVAGLFNVRAIQVRARMKLSACMSWMS